MSSGRCGYYLLSLLKRAGAAGLREEKNGHPWKDDPTTFATGLERDGKEHRLKPVPPKNRNASRVARRSTERDNHIRIDSWYSRGKSGQGKKEKDNAEAQRTQSQRRGKLRKRNAEKQRAQRREDPPFQKANPKKWATPERCKVGIVSQRISIVHAPGCLSIRREEFLDGLPS